MTTRGINNEACCLVVLTAPGCLTSRDILRLTRRILIAILVDNIACLKNRFLFVSNKVKGFIINERVHTMCIFLDRYMLASLRSLLFYMSILWGRSIRRQVASSAGRIIMTPICHSIVRPQLSVTTTLAKAIVSKKANQRPSR